MPPLPQGYGVISTVAFTGTLLEKNFTRGVRMGYTGQLPYVAQQQENLRYDEAALATAVGNLNNDGGVGLIVTVGGVASAIAANKHANKFFLSLFAATPDFDGTAATAQANFWGASIWTRSRPIKRESMTYAPSLG